MSQVQHKNIKILNVVSNINESTTRALTMIKNLRSNNSRIISNSKSSRINSPLTLSKNRVNSPTFPFNQKDSRFRWQKENYLEIKIEGKMKRYVSSISKEENNSCSKCNQILSIKIEKPRDIIQKQYFFLSLETFR